MTQEYFENLAFISYSHADKKTAEYIHDKLNEYHVPQVIISEHPELDEIDTNFKIFRDNNFSHGGMLWKHISYKLETSKYLIVICSPNSAKCNSDGENWIDKEVSYFLSVNKPERVIPVIISGVVHSKDEELQCYCPTLEAGHDGDEFYGIDGTKIDKENPFETDKDTEADVLGHIKAALLGLGYDSYRKYVHSVKYYKDYVDRNGILYGIHELDESIVAKKESHYRFSYKEGLLDRVSYENSHGKVIAHGDLDELHKVVDYTFIYDSEGNLIKTANRDENGKLVRMQKYEKNYSTVNFFDEKSESLRLSAHLSVSGNLTGSKEKADIKSVHLERDARGYIVKRTYHKHHNEHSPVSDADGIYGLEYELDDKGRVTAEFYLDYSERRKTSKRGIAGRIFVYDENDDRIKLSFVDKDRNPVMTESRYAVEKDFYDEAGNRISEEYYGCNNDPVIREHGWFRIEKKYDDFGNETERRLYDTEGKLVVGNGDWCYAKQVMKYDGRGNCTESACYRDEENLMLNGDGAAILRGKYDYRGNCTEYAYYGTEKEPVMSKLGCHKVLIVYDDFGNETEYRLYDTEGKFVVGNGDQCCAKLVKKYDGRGNCIETAFYRDEENLMLDGDGIAIVRRKYDDRGNCTEYAYYGTEKEPVMRNGGFHKQVCVYDDFGNTIEVRHYDTEGNLVVGNGDWCYAKQVMKYDGRGNCTESARYRDEENLMLDKEGIAIVRCEYDDRGNQTEVAYYGTDKEPVMRKKGFHKIIYVYDAFGNETEQRLYDTEGRLVVGTGDFCYAKLVRKYDSLGNCIETATYRDEENLMLNGDGIAVVRNKYDDRGNRTEEACYGTEKEPVMSKDGFHKIMYVYDNFGNETEHRLYDTEGKLVVGIGIYCHAKVVQKYDGRENCIETAYYRDEENLMVNADGNAIIRRRFDDRNNYVDSKVFGVDGEPVLSLYGFHHKVNRFDSYGNRIEELCYDQNEKLVVCEFSDFDDGIPRKYARRTLKYDSFKNCTEECFYKNENQLMLGIGGFARVSRKYSPNGVLLEEEFFGVDGEPVNTSRGFQKIIYRYDEVGNCLGEDHVKVKESLKSKFLRIFTR